MNAEVHLKKIEALYKFHLFEKVKLSYILDLLHVK